MFLAVTLGAFAAHVLNTRLAPDRFTAFEVGVRYHAYHALALLALAWVIVQFPDVRAEASAWFFVAGTILFSGSLYLLALTGVRWLGMITPAGGVCFLAGWLWLAWRVWKSI